MSPPVASSWPEWLACAAAAAGGLILLGGRNRRLLIRAGGLLALALALVGVVFLILFPIPKAPPLPGPHAVGTLTFEIPAAGPEPRLLSQVWYPAARPADGRPSQWLPDSGLAPSFPFHRLARASARAKIGAPLCEGPKLPVIFYEHSWTGHRAENVAQVEALASKGFVIVAVDHPEQAARVMYADGSVVSSKLPASLDLGSASGVAAFETTARRCLDQRMSNVKRVIESLDHQAVTELHRRLNLDRLGVFGFSFGGTSALRLCAHLPSFHAGANEDGLILGDEMPRGPFFFFDQEMPAWLLTKPEPGENAGQTLTRRSENRILEAMKQPSRHRVILDGTTHDSFNDRIFFSRFPQLARAGKRPAAEVHQILTSHLADFFSRELAASGHP